MAGNAPLSMLKENKHVEETLIRHASTAVRLKRIPSQTTDLLLSPCREITLNEHEECCERSRLLVTFSFKQSLTDCICVSTKPNRV